MRNEGTSRREILRTAGLLSAVGAFATVVGPLNASKADAATPTYQSNWRYCRACACLKYSNGTSFEQGDACAYNADYGYNGGAHDSGSRNYYLYTSASGVSGQSGWRYCTNCSEIFWPSAGGLCPYSLTQPHHAAGYTYVMLTTETTNPNAGQSGWRYCSQCKALVWPPSVAINQCTAVGNANHKIGGYDYILPYF